jgi:ABC-type enterochelin transport system substrate-binding protein
MKLLVAAVLVFSLALFAFAAEDVVTATHGTITKIDMAGKTVAIKTADGTEHVFHWTKETAVHGVGAGDTAAKDSWHGLTEGSEVVAHSTEHGTEATAVEVDKVGDNGLHKTEGTVKEIDRGTKKLIVQSSDGAEHTFQLSGHAAADAGKDVASGTKVVVYSTEASGKKVAHFFEKL